MNDRFKFRGIHPILGELQEIKYIDFIHNTVDFGDGDIFKIEEVNMQQCTGLKDKNGKLIYEGDIVATLIKNLGGKTIIDTPEVVEYDEKLCMLRTHFSTLSKQTEVIGNIYENKELLNENS